MNIMFDVLDGDIVGVHDGIVQHPGNGVMPLGRWSSCGVSYAFSVLTLGGETRRYIVDLPAGIQMTGPALVNGG
jgi:hypothetical protein